MNEVDVPEDRSGEADDLALEGHEPVLREDGLQVLHKAGLPVILRHCTKKVRLQSRHGFR